MKNEDFRYSILDFAVNYIQNRKGFSNYEMDNKIQVNINKLNGNLENLKKDIHLTNKYHPLSLFPKTDNERIATLYMLKAIEVSKSKNYSAVDEFFELVKGQTLQMEYSYMVHHVKMLDEEPNIKFHLQKINQKEYGQKPEQKHDTAKNHFYTP